MASPVDSVLNKNKLNNFDVSKEVEGVNIGMNKVSTKDANISRAGNEVNTSFQSKRRSKLVQIRGTKASVQTGQLILSTGVSSLNALLGGGLTVGSLLLIEEDESDSYSRVLLKYFLAEGVMSGHKLFVASAREHPDDIIQDLPSPILTNEPEHKPPASTAADQPDGMKIAWRYQNLPKVPMPLSSSSQFGHCFDLSARMQQDHLNMENIHTFYLPDEHQLPQSQSAALGEYAPLLQSIQSTIRRHGLDGTNPQVKERNVMRIAVRSLGSALWGDDVCFRTPHAHGSSLLTFLYALRALLRSSLSAAVVTVPAHLIQSETLKGRIIRLSDTAISLHAFSDYERKNNPLCKDYHGLLRVLQVPRLNCLTYEAPDTNDLGFRLKRKQFTIERMYLPPDESESVSRISKVPPASSCESNPHKHLDF